MLIDSKLLAVAAIGAGLAGFVAGYSFSDNRWQSKWDNAETKAAQNQLQVVNNAVLNHNFLTGALEKNSEKTQTNLVALHDSVQLTADAGDSLQQQFADSMRTECNPAQSAPTTADLAAKATNGLVQTYVFGIVKNRAVEYAKIADENRIIGLSCQDDYEALRLSCSTKF